MVLEKAWMVPRETWYQLAKRAPTVPAMAIQPRGLRLDAGLRHGSASMMRTPVRVRMSSGRRARTLVDIYFLASVPFLAFALRVELVQTVAMLRIFDSFFVVSAAAGIKLNSAVRSAFTSVFRISLFEAARTAGQPGAGAGWLRFAGAGFICSG